MNKTFLSNIEGLSLLAIFAVIMIGLIWFRSKGQSHADGFLVADRKLSFWQGAFSIAVSWVWAPAIFICSMQAFNFGLPGIFWFTVPNIICFFIFAVFAVRLRKLMPEGYTIAEYMDRRFPKNPQVHLLFLFVFIGYEFFAVLNNALAGGILLNAVSGISVSLAIILMSGIALAYSLMSGLKASVFTDVIQMLMILLLAFILVPWCIIEAGGVGAVSAGFSGLSGEYGNIMNPWVAFSMGIPMTLSLIAGPFVDQMFFQRTWAVKKAAVKKTFIAGGIIFGLVPITLSLLGFLGVSLVNLNGLVVNDPQMVGPAVIAELLPKFALYMFCLMAFAGLCSTIDSGYCAASSLGAIDIYKRYINPEAGDKKILKFSRQFMVLIAILATCVALLQPKILWVFFISGALASCVLFPVMFAIASSRVSAKAVFYSIILSLLLATPLSIYANIKNDPYLVVVASVLSVVFGLMICTISVLGNKAISR